MNNSINDFVNSPLSDDVAVLLSFVALFVGLVVIYFWTKFLGERF